MVARNLWHISVLPVLLFTSASSQSQSTKGALHPAEKLILIPLDDRPAATQFSQMIGRIAGAEIELPPSDLLGKFTRPGNPDGILNWLAGKDLSQYSAVVVSTDMIAYGGLIASRTNSVGYDLAIQRLRCLQKIRRSAKGTRFYAFSAIMRLAPTATKRNSAWRMSLARYSTLRERYLREADRTVEGELDRLELKIPAGEIDEYLDTRARDHKVQEELVRMNSGGVFDYLILGQDDAQPHGPHVFETNRLREMVHNLRIESKVYFCEGIDQHASVLISRALLAESHWAPRVRIMYADERGKYKIANFESTGVEQSLRDQLLASGAKPAPHALDFDYSLYVNTPEPGKAAFQAFVDSLKSEIDQGFPVAVADINLGKIGTGDPALFKNLRDNSRATKLLSYAGWNTAGNTMGTAIPAANVYLLSRRRGTEPLEREIAQHAFLLHRLVDDFEYHRFTRPQAYAMIDANPRACREETYGVEMAEVSAFVKDDIERRLDETFREQLLGKRFFAGPRQYVFTGLSNVQVCLPWPRAYEVKIGFQLDAVEVPASLSNAEKKPSSWLGSL